ncbi:ATP-binding protein [Peptoniphilus gorbachii]|uniref:ORC1/DEAH AAA+ ATPase domain-containing protein n=1 Tax=Peptoniphilus gorbachii TaxID=411567 RepID=A0ABS2MHW0_9FIRM|nr:ATP-binding protein [Peptoniphilus gorbachii]MBM7549609.1 hypothetical protein [Peptoniphilus gorbachii]
MKNFKNFKYEYTENKSYETNEEFYSQKYENRDGKNVDAIYTPPISQLDKGNIFVEALPRMRSEDRLILDANVDLPEFNHDKLIRRPLSEQIALLNDLYSLRILLPIQKNLDAIFYNLISRVYRSREYEITKDTHKEHDGREWTETLAYGKLGEAPPSGFSLLGYAGSGKTSMLQTMFSHYPQVIWHKSEGHVFPQLLYIMCNSNASSQNDFSAVLNDVCRQIDIAIGNNNFYYYNQVVKMANYDRKIGLIKKLINLFNIGVIAIDEIQSLDFNKNNKETYSKLLQITNDTKVGFILCGTEEAYDNMFSSLHMTRRFLPITASSYTGDIAFSEMFVRNLLRFQWFNEKDMIDIPPYGETNEAFQEFVSTIYNCTNGIIALMVNLYEKINFEYLIRKRKPKVNGKFVESVFAKYFSGVDKILRGLDKDFSAAATKKVLTQSNTRKEEALAQIEVKKELDKIVSLNYKTDQELKRDLLNNITRSIAMVMGSNFSEEEIRTACKTVLARKESQGKTEASLTRDVVNQLNSKPKKAKKVNDIPQSLAKITRGEE